MSGRGILLLVVLVVALLGGAAVLLLRGPTGPLTDKETTVSASDMEARPVSGSVIDLEELTARVWEALEPQLRSQEGALNPSDEQALREAVRKILEQFQAEGTLPQRVEMERLVEAVLELLRDQGKLREEGLP